jgi:hypothetical protein
MGPQTETYSLAVVHAHTNLYLNDQIKHFKLSKLIAQQLHITSSIGGLLVHWHLM